MPPAMNGRRENMLCHRGIQSTGATELKSFKQ